MPRHRAMLMCLSSVRHRAGADRRERILNVRDDIVSHDDWGRPWPETDHRFGDEPAKVVERRR